MAENLSYKLDVQTGQSAKNLTDVAKEAQGLGKQLDELSSAGPIKIKADTKAAQSDVDSFATKLEALSASDQVVLLSLKAAAAQTELTQIATDVAGLDSSDPTVEIKLARYAEVSGDLQSLQGKINAIADTPVDSGGLGRELGGVTTKLEGMRGEADNSRSVLANMVGNSAQDLGQLGGVAGTAGVALGQLAEYAADGNISMSGLAAVAGPMALLGGATAAVTALMSTFQKEAAEAAKIKAFNVENATVYADAIRDNTNLLDAYIEKAETAGGVDVAPNAEQQSKALALIPQALNGAKDNLFVFTKGVQDVGPLLVRAGVSARDFYGATQAGGPALADFTAKIEGSNLSAKDQVRVLAAANYQVDEYAQGQALAADRAALFGDATTTAATSAQAAASANDHLSTSAQDYADQQSIANTNAAEGAGLLNGLAASTTDTAGALDQLADAQQHSTDVLKAHTDAQNADKQALEDAQSAALAAIDAKYADSKATADQVDAVAAYDAAISNTESTLKDIANATDRAFDATLSKSEADVRASGAAAGSQAAIDGQIASLSAQAGALAPGSPLRQRIEEYIADLNAIPRTINTNLHVSQSGDVSVNLGGGRKALASGTQGATPGPHLTAEAGQEIVVDTNGDTHLIKGPTVINYKGGEQVYNAGQTAAILAGGAGTGPGAALGGYATGTGQIVQNITHITTPAATTANGSNPVQDAKDATDAQIREQDRLQKAMYTTGRISLAQYREYVKGRLDASADLSDDFVAQYELIQSLNDKEASDAKNVQDRKDADAAAEKQRNADAIADEDARQKAMYEDGVTSAADYQAYLNNRQGAYAAYSTQWQAIHEQLKAIDDKTQADLEANAKREADRITAIYTHAQDARNQALAEAQGSADLADVYAKGDEGARIQNDRSATAEDKAQAIQDLVNAQIKFADDLYKTALATAQSAGLPVGSVAWDRMVRANLQAGIGGYAGFDVTVGKLQGYLNGIPALAEGGIIPGSPLGQLVRAGENNRSEVIGPLSALTGLGGGDTHNYYVTVNTLTGKLSPRDLTYLADELEKNRRRNGRSAAASPW